MSDDSIPSPADPQFAPPPAAPPSAQPAPPYPGAAPVYGSSAPVYGSSAPAYGSSAPAYGSSAPVLGTEQPAYSPPAPPQPYYGAATPAPQAPAYPAYGAPAYPPAPAYGAPAYAPPRASSGLAITSLICGIAGIVLFWAVVPVLASIAAVITGHMALRQTKQNPAIGGRGMAFAGLIMGYVMVAVLLIGVVTMIASFLFIGAFTLPFIFSA